MNKVNDISKINENLASLFHAKFEMTFPLPFHFIKSGDISHNPKSLFHPIIENAIDPKNPLCHDTSRFIPRNPAPTSRKDKCKPVALCHPAIATDNLR